MAVSDAIRNIGASIFGDGGTPTAGLVTPAKTVGISPTNRALSPANDAGGVVGTPQTGSTGQTSAGGIPTPPTLPKIPQAPSGASTGAGNFSSPTTLDPNASTTNSTTIRTMAAPAAAATAPVTAAASPAASPAAPAPAASPVAAAPVATGSAPTAAPAAAPAAAPTSTGIAPTAFNEESAADQYAKLTSSDSLLMRQAAQSGLNTANKRGLVNSSAAVGAAQAAQASAALPLATQDAQTAATRNLQKSQEDAAMAQIIKNGDITTAQQIRDLDAKMAQLQYSTNAADQQQLRDLAAQKDRLLTAGQQAIEQISAQGQINFTLADKNNAAEMSRLQASLANSNDQQSKQIAADMAKTQADAQAEMDRLKTQLASAEGQQKLQIQADMDKLQVSTAATLQQLQVQGQQALQQIGAKGAIDTSIADKQIQADLTKTSIQGDQALAQIGAKGAIDTGITGMNNQAAMDQLQAKITADTATLDKQIAAATGQQKTDLEAQKERLILDGQQQMERLQAAGSLDQQKALLQGQIESAISAQGADQTAKLTQLQGSINSALQKQTDDSSFDRLNASLKNNLDVAQAGIAGDLQKLAASGGQQMAQLLQTQQGDLQKLSMNLASNDKQAIATAAVQIFANESAMRQALLGNTAMPASERASYEAAIAKMADPLRAYLDQLYSAPATGSGGTGIAPSSAPTTASAASPSTGIAPTAAPAPAAPAPTSTGIAPVTTAGGESYTYSNGKFYDSTGAQISAAKVQQMNALQ